MKVNKCKKTIKTIMTLIYALCISMSFYGCKQENKEIDIEKYLYSCMEITCTEDGYVDSIGSGFKAKYGYIYTNAHILTYTFYNADENKTEKKVYSGIYGKFYKTENAIALQVKKIDLIKDIAILECKEVNEEYNKIEELKVRESKIKIGEDVYAIGNINGYGIAVNKGIISSENKEIEKNGEKNKYIQTDIEIAKGSSGGAVIDKNGEVIGIMTFKLRDNNGEYVDGMSFAIPFFNVTEIL